MLGCPIFHIWLVARQYSDYVSESMYFSLLALWWSEHFSRLENCSHTVCQHMDLVAFCFVSAISLGNVILLATSE